MSVPVYSFLLEFVCILFFICNKNLPARDSQFEFGSGHKFKSIQFVNDSTGFIVGDAGLILKTWNGGETWDEEQLNAESTLNDIYIVGEQKGYIVGDSGLVLKTDDFGNNWYELTLNSSQNLNAVYFINSDTGFVFGDESTLLRTFNSGSTWTTVPVLAGLTLVDGCFPSINKGYAICEECIVMRTTDLGNTWDYYIASGDYRYLYSMFFVDADTGYVGGWDWDTGMILKTVDGGNNWDYQWPGLFQVFSIFFPDQNIGYAAGIAVSKTNDGGLTWGEQLNFSFQINSLYFINSDTGFAVGTDSTIIKTIDGGENWIHTDIHGLTENIPSDFLLFQNYPNPFNPNTTISFYLPQGSPVKLAVYDVTGRQVKTLISSRYPAGTHQVQWDGRDDHGNTVASGIYIYRIEAGKYSQSRKMMLLK